MKPRVITLVFYAFALSIQVNLGLCHLSSVVVGDDDWLTWIAMLWALLFGSWALWCCWNWRELDLERQRRKLEKRKAA